jgi:hypothetical protein
MSIPQQSTPSDATSKTKAGATSAADESPKPSTERRAPWWLTLFKPKVGIPLAILIVLASIPLAIRSWRMSSLPHIDEPFDVEAFCSVTIPDEENAFVEYREAFGLFFEFSGTQNDWNSYDALIRGNCDSAPPVFVAWLKVNTHAFDVWLKGTTKPDAMFMPRRDVTNAAIGYTSKARSVVRFAMLRAGRHLHNGNTTEAWKILHAAFRFSRHVGQNGPKLERHTGISMLPIVGTGILSWAHHANTTAEDLEHAIVVLSDEFASMTPPYSETLKHEYLVEQNFLRSLGPGTRGFTNLPILDSGLMFVLGEPEYSQVLLDLLFSNQVAGIDIPPSARPKLVTGDNRVFDIPAVPGKCISGVDLRSLLAGVSATAAEGGGLPWMSQSIFAVNIEQTAKSTILAVLSVEWYVRKHGRFPSSLGEFPKSWAIGLFADPYHSTSGDIIYRADDEFAVFYGLGADGFDDGHDVAPHNAKQQNSWSQLRHDDRQWFEGYRIPLWRPTAEVQTDENNAAGVPDNVQD